MQRLRQKSSLQILLAQALAMQIISTPELRGFAMKKARATQWTGLQRIA
jgi:hypothetical protein